MTNLRILYVFGIVGVLCTQVQIGAWTLTQTQTLQANSLPPTIPIFPLGDIMLFPKTTRRLHIFERRYRDMVADALKGNRLIGMVLLRPGYDMEYEGRPPVYPIGCVGVIVAVEELSDGRYNILLRGLTKFRITGENDSRSYRLAKVKALPEKLTEAERANLADLREELSLLLPSSAPGLEVPADLPDENLINGLAQVIDLDPRDRLGLLEQPSLLARAQALVNLLHIRLALPR